MPGEKERKATSQAQARFLGAVISGEAKAPKGLSKKEAKDMLRGVDVDSLPEKKEDDDDDKDD